MIINFNPPKEPKCSECGKKKSYHKAVSENCPTGSKTRIGYTSYGSTTFKEKIVPKKYVFCVFEGREDEIKGLLEIFKTKKLAEKFCETKDSIVGKTYRKNPYSDNHYYDGKGYELMIIEKEVKS